MAIPDDRTPLKSISPADHAAMTRLTKADLRFFKRFKRKYRLRVTAKVEAEQLERLYGKETLPDGMRLFTVAHKIPSGGVDYLYTAYKKDADADKPEEFCCELFWIIARKIGNIKRFKLEANL